MDASVLTGVTSWGRDVRAAVAAEGLDLPMSPHSPRPPRFEDSRLDVCVYELHVWLLAADRRTVIAQHHVAPRTSGRGPPGRWVQVRLSAPAPSPRHGGLPRPHGEEGGEQGS